MPRYFKVTKVPCGEAPEWVRQAWVGCVMPLAEDLPEGSEVVGVLSFRLQPYQGGFSVSFTEAMKALTPHPNALEWWLTNMAPVQRCGWLVFGSDECQLVQAPA